jgi:hypothetical protein
MTADALGGCAQGVFRCCTAARDPATEVLVSREYARAMAGLRAAMPPAASEGPDMAVAYVYREPAGGRAVPFELSRRSAESTGFLRQRATPDYLAQTCACLTVAPLSCDLGVDVKVIQTPLSIFLYGESRMKYTKRRLNDFNVLGYCDSP